MMTNTVLAEIAAELVASAHASGRYMSDKMAAEIVRVELARMHVAMGAAEGRAQRLAESNDALAPHGLRIVDCEAL